MGHILAGSKESFNSTLGDVIQFDLRIFNLGGVLTKLGGGFNIFL